MSGVRLEAGVHMVTASSSAIQNIKKCVNRCGIKVQDVVLEQLASSYAVLTEDEKELGFTYDFVEFYTGMYLKWDENEINNVLKNLNEDSYREFIKFEEKCVAVHNRNKHKLNGVVNL